MKKWLDINDTALRGANLTIKAFTDEREIEEEEKFTISLNEYKETKIGEKNYILQIEPQTKISELKSKISTNGNIKITEGTAEVEENRNLITGMNMIITLNEDKTEYIVVVAGDVDKDGDADLWDMSRINKYRLGKIKISNEEALAGDVDNDGDADLWDMSRINKHRLGKINKLLI